MGGVWSGRRSRGGSNIDNVPGIDIRFLKRKTELTPGCTGSLSWSLGNQNTGSINYVIDKDAIYLLYQNRARGADPRKMSYGVKLERTPCHYGGERIWLLCPCCSRRVVVIYSRGAYFHCRRCCGLSYASQAEIKADRMRRKARKIRERLGASNNLFEPVLVRPKGMHEKTFQGLVSEERKVNLASFEALPKGVMALLGID